MMKLRARGPASDADNPSKREAERFYSQATRDFDKWFYAQSRDKQEAMRRDGVIPYREMKANEYVFPVNTMSDSAVITPLYDPSDKVDSDTFYSREKVEEYTRRLLRTLEYSHSEEVRLHFELIRLVLRDSEAMTNDALAKRFNMTRAGINFRVQRIRQVLSCGKDGKYTVSTKMLQNTQENRGKMASNPVKESPKGGVKPRVAAHRGKNTRGRKVR